MKPRPKQPDRIRAILVRRPDGNVSVAYNPNHVGATVAELMEAAKADAERLGGTVEIYYHE